MGFPFQKENERKRKEKKIEENSKHIPHLLVFTTFVGLIFLISFFLKNVFFFCFSFFSLDNEEKMKMNICIEPLDMIIIYINQ